MSGPVAATVAPALASAVIASARAVVRSVTRPAEAAAISSRDARVGDELAAADHDQMAGRVLELAHQVAGDEHRPALGRQRAQEAAHPHDPLRVHAVERLIEDQDRRDRRASPRRARAAGASRARSRPPCAAPPTPARPARSPRRRAAPTAPGSGPATADGCARCGSAAARRHPAASRPGAAGGAGSRTAVRRSGRCPRSTASSPRMTRIVVDLPAPLGPTNPVTLPGATVNDRPSRATACPNRLCTIVDFDGCFHARKR